MKLYCYNWIYDVFICIKLNWILFFYKKIVGNGNFTFRNYLGTKTPKEVLYNCPIAPQTQIHRIVARIKLFMINK